MGTTSQLFNLCSTSLNMVHFATILLLTACLYAVIVCEDGTEEVDEWCEYADSYLYTYASRSFYRELEKAQEACLARSNCNGITQEPNRGNKYTLRVGPTLHEGK